MDEITLTVRLTDSQAWRIAQFLKRLRFQQCLELAEGNGEARTEDAYSTRDALYIIALELARVGYNPR